MQKKWKEYRPSGFPEYEDDEEGHGESRVVEIKSSPNIGVPDRRGRELINCRSEGQRARSGRGKEGADRVADRKTAVEAGERR